MEDSCRKVGHRLLRNRKRFSLRAGTRGAQRQCGNTTLLSMPALLPAWRSRAPAMPAASAHGGLVFTEQASALTSLVALGAVRLLRQFFHELKKHQ